MKRILNKATESNLTLISQNYLTEYVPESVPLFKIRSLPT
jgi:hypothetical protein